MTTTDVQTAESADPPSSSSGPFAQVPDGLARVDWASVPTARAERKIARRLHGRRVYGRYRGDPAPQPLKLARPPSARRHRAKPLPVKGSRRQRASCQGSDDSRGDSDPGDSDPGDSDPGDSDPDGLTREAAGETERACVCGCGESIAHLRWGAWYLNPTHRKRGERLMREEPQQSPTLSIALAEWIERKEGFLADLDTLMRTNGIRHRKREAA